MERQRRVKFSVEVRSGAARYRVGVHSQSVREAPRLVGDRHPRGVLEVAFPTEAESFSFPERAHELAA